MALLFPGRRRSGKYLPDTAMNSRLDREKSRRDRDTAPHRHVYPGRTARPRPCAGNHPPAVGHLRKRPFLNTSVICKMPVAEEAAPS
jgi:hypothetical protein